MSDYDPGVGLDIYGKDNYDGNSVNFGFHVSKRTYQNGNVYYRVDLPHQCDNWQIAGETYSGATSKDAAIVDLQLFIIEAQEALDALREAE